MTVFDIGGVNLVDYIVSGGFSISLTPQSGGNEFICTDGTTIGDKTGDKITLSVELSRVPDAYAKVISQAVSKPTFDITYSTPCTATTTFRKTSYKAIARKKCDSWDISLSVESAALVNTGGSL